ncbi:hypothetical protein EVC12_022 [Rhizobium phage RHph_I42]|nr:hypothetical protein EVC12_022 [Rhizobium phage RHph_I42]
MENLLTDAQTRKGSKLVRTLMCLITYPPLFFVVLLRCAAHSLGVACKWLCVVCDIVAEFLVDVSLFSLHKN